MWSHNRGLTGLRLDVEGRRDSGGMPRRTWVRLPPWCPCHQGIAKAKDAGKYKGRAPTARKQSAAVLARLQAGAKPTTVAAEMGISRASVYRIKGEVDAKDQNATAT